MWKGLEIVRDLGELQGAGHGALILAGSLRLDFF